MQLSQEMIQTYLNSNHPDQIQLAVASLKERADKGAEFEIPFFYPQILQAFENNMPEEMQLQLLDIFKQYRLFAPPVSDEERIEAMMAIVLQYAVPYVAFTAALKLKIANDPVKAVHVAMKAIVKQGLSSSNNTKGASYFVSRLIDGKDPVRRVTLESLRGWPEKNSCQEVIAYVKPQLTADELERLKPK